MSSKNRFNDVPALSEIDGAGASLLVVLTVIFYFAAFRPLLDRQRSEVAQQHELEIQRIKAEQASLGLQSARDHLASIRGAISDSPQKLAPVRALNDRLAGITALATAGGLDLADIRPGVVAAAAHYTTVPISLVGTGRFQDCVRYVHELHQRFSDTTVTALRLSGNPEDPASSSFQFELRWYAAPERTTGTAPQASLPR